MIKRVESKTTGSTGHNAISFLSHPPYRVSLFSPSPHTHTHTLCTRSPKRLIAVRATFICLIQYFLPLLSIHLPTYLPTSPFSLRLIFRGRRRKKQVGERVEVYKVSRGRGGGGEVCLCGGENVSILPLLPPSSSSLARATAPGRVMDRDRGEEEGGAKKGERVLHVNETNRGSLGSTATG